METFNVFLKLLSLLLRMNSTMPPRTSPPWKQNFMTSRMCVCICIFWCALDKPSKKSCVCTCHTLQTGYPGYQSLKNKKKEKEERIMRKMNIFLSSFYFFFIFEALVPRVARARSKEKSIVLDNFDASGFIV